MNFIDKLESKALELGASKIGFSNVEQVVSGELSHLKYGITVIIRLSDEIVNQIKDAPTYTYFHHYRNVNAFIDQICLQLSLMIQDEGYFAMNVPASQTVHAQKEKYRAVFPHKTAAVLAGMGWIGKNDLLITKDYGPRIRMGTILTNMEVPYSDMIYESQCGNCTLCVDACPADAIKGNNWVRGMERSELLETESCVTHMKKYYHYIGRGSVCGLCMRACPQGNKVLKK